MYIHTCVYIYIYISGRLAAASAQELPPAAAGPGLAGPGLAGPSRVTSRGGDLAGPSRVTSRVANNGRDVRLRICARIGTRCTG